MILRWVPEYMVMKVKIPLRNMKVDLNESRVRLKRFSKFDKMVIGLVYTK